MAMILSSQAWDVPNSNMVVVLKKMAERVWIGNVKDRYYYIAGVSTRQGKSDTIGYTFFNEMGEDPYSAFENLMLKIDKAVEFMFKVFDYCNSNSVSDIEVVKSEAWETWRTAKSFDFATMCFSSMSRMIYLLEKNDGMFSIKLHSKDCDYNSHIYYAGIEIGIETAFRAKPANRMQDAIENLKMAFIGAGAMLEKFQGMAWNVMIDSGDPEYSLESNRFANGSKLKRNTKEVASAGAN